MSHQVQQLLAPTWGAFPKLSKADADTNPDIHGYSYQLGVGGKGLFPGGPADRFGVGYYRFAFSRVLGELIEPALAIEPERRDQALFNVQVIPGLFVTANLQWVAPARRDRGRSVFAGMRIMSRL